MRSTVISWINLIECSRWRGFFSVSRWFCSSGLKSNYTTYSPSQSPLSFFASCSSMSLYFIVISQFLSWFLLVFHCLSCFYLCLSLSLFLFSHRFRSLHTPHILFWIIVMWLFDHSLSLSLNRMKQTTRLLIQNKVFLKKVTCWSSNEAIGTRRSFYILYLSEME